MGSKVGNLVFVPPGNYLTKITSEKKVPAQILLRDATLGLVIDEILDRKVVMIHDEKNNCIFVRDALTQEA